MALRSFLAVALAGMGVLACGAGDTAGTTLVADNSPPANPNQPAGNSEQPAVNPAQPPPNPDQPASGSGTGTSGSCGGLCQILLTCFASTPGLDRSAFLTACQAECEQEFAAAPGCEAELAAFASCAVAAGLLCEIDDGDDIDFQAPQCLAQATALAACQEREEPQDTCTAPNCVCDQDPCEICYCQLGDDSAECAALCEASG